MSITQPQANSSDPSILRQVERENAGLLPTATLSYAPSTSGPIGAAATSSSSALAPVVRGSETLYPQSTATTSANSVTITSSLNNSDGDITTVYTSNASISVTPINQTINQFTAVDSGVTSVVAGNGITISSTSGNGRGVVTISSTISNLGNIATINLDGNSSNVLHGDGSWSADETNYSNSNVAAYMPTYLASYTGVVSASNVSSPVLTNDSGNIDITAGDAGGPTAGTVTIVGGYSSGNLGGPVHIIGGGSSLGSAYYGVVTIQSGARIWQFDAIGNLTFPDDSTQNTAFTGTIDTGNVTGLGNIATINLDGNVSNVLRGDGTWGVDANSSYGDSNVTSLLGAFGSNTIVTTGNVTVGNIIGQTDGLAIVGGYNPNVFEFGGAVHLEGGSGDSGGAINISGGIGSGGLNGDVFIGIAGTQWRFGSTGTFTLPGNTLAIKYANGSNVFGNISSLNLDGNSQTWLAGNGVFANIAIPTVGNIATINLDGNASNVLLGNGVFSGVPSYPNAVVWTTAPVSNTSTGTAGQAAYDAGGNLFVCVATDTWAKFTGTLSW